MGTGTLALRSKTKRGAVMSEELTETKIINERAERIRFIMLVIGFIALAMLSARENQPLPSADNSPIASKSSNIVSNQK